MLRTTLWIEEARQGEITRTGPATALDVQGAVVTWAVPLNETPQPVWLLAFGARDADEPACLATEIRFGERAMIFDSEERDLQAWIRSIDLWIADANDTVAA